MIDWTHPVHQRDTCQAGDLYLNIQLYSHLWWPLIGVLTLTRGFVSFRLHYHQYFYQDNISRWLTMCIIVITVFIYLFLISITSSDFCMESVIKWGRDISRGFSKLVYRHGHPNLVPNKIFQVILFLMEHFGLIFCFFFNQIQSKGLKKMCDCTL